MTTAASIRRRIERLEREQKRTAMAQERTQRRAALGATPFVEVRLSEPPEVREARVEAVRARRIADGWTSSGPDDFCLVVIELDDSEFD